MTSGQHQTDEKILSRREFADPYDAMTDDEFDAYVGRLFDAPSGPTRSITVRLPETLIVRLQRIAAERQVPYQRLLKRMLEEAVSGLERRTHSRGAKPPEQPPRGR